MESDLYRVDLHYISVINLLRKSNFAILYIYLKNMGSGYLKRKNKGFQKGNKMYKLRTKQKSAKKYDSKGAKKYKRLSLEQYQSLGTKENGVIVAQKTDGTEIEGVGYLRPSKKESNREDKFYATYLEEQGMVGSEELYGLMHFRKTAELFNIAIKEHGSDCSGDLQWDMDRSRKWGLCRIMALKCMTCSYQSACRKLYSEVESAKKGPKAAGPNISVQVSLARQGIGPSGFTDLLHGMQMEAPSLNALYKTSHMVSAKLVDENKRDMCQKLEELKELNEQLGRPRNYISVEADATYNNKLYSGVGKTPQQPGTQATHLMAENMSPHKYVLRVGTYNKLCRSCPRGQHGGANCTQTVPTENPIGNEGQYLEDAIHDLNDKGAFITEVTMDGDSSAQKAAEEVGQYCPDSGRDSGIIIKCQRCVRHMGQSVRQDIKNRPFSHDMFGGVNLVQKKYLQGRFALDIVFRMQAETKALCNMYKGDEETIIHKAEYLPETLIKCYTGDCTSCYKHSLVCSKKQPWKRPYLNTINISRGRAFIRPNEEDVRMLIGSLEKRFNPERMALTYKNQTSNKVEGCNRAIAKAVPKSITFSRAYPGRAHASIHSVNNLPGVSLLALNRSLGSSLPACSGLLRQLKQGDKRYHYIRRLQKEPKHKRSKAATRDYNFRNYDERLNDKYYKKGLADEDGAIPSTSGEPKRAKRISQARIQNVLSIQESFGSQGWDHTYHYYPRYK